MTAGLAAHSVNLSSETKFRSTETGGLTLPIVSDCEEPIVNGSFWGLQVHSSLKKSHLFEQCKCAHAPWPRQLFLQPRANQRHHPFYQANRYSFNSSPGCWNTKLNVVWNHWGCLCHRVVGDANPKNVPMRARFWTRSLAVMQDGCHVLSISSAFLTGKLPDYDGLSNCCAVPTPSPCRRIHASYGLSTASYPNQRCLSCFASAAVVASAFSHRRCESIPSCSNCLHLIPSHHHRAPLPLSSGRDTSPEQQGQN